MSSSYCSCEETQKCFCGIPVAIMKSWTPTNPGRRFEACKFYNPNSGFRGCKFFRWYDKPQTEWQRDAINELKLENKHLKCDVQMLTEEVEWLKQERKKHMYELEKIKMRANEDVVVNQFVNRSLYNKSYVTVGKIALIFIIACLSFIVMKAM
ncbi:uncharacterized protein LOC141595377 [Silene latifolia]|uniref:uncharacterized protein LOC141595377 n=1 Tax=Silene latifolia TaxID=37657 RepID=UPI003D777514